jgi:transcription elongation factor Elf1
MHGMEAGKGRQPMQAARVLQTYRGDRMKIKLKNYGTEFDLHCPRCGKDQWSDKVFSTGLHLYHKCLNCGTDVSAEQKNGGTDITVVVESQFKRAPGSNTIKDRIKKDLNEPDVWHTPVMPEDE